MVKRMISFFVAALLILSVAPTIFASFKWNTVGENLIYNPSFTNGIGDWYQQPNGILKHDSDTGHDAPGAGLVTGRTSITQQVYQPLTLEEGATYLVTAWVKLKDLKDEEIGTINILTSNTTIVTAYQTSVKASSSEWKELSLTIVVDDPDKKVNVGFTNYTDVNLEFYIDDVSVKKIDMGTNLMHNPSFTNGIGDWYQQLKGMLVYDAEVGHNAPGSGLVTGRTSVTQQVYQPLTLEEGVTYYVSAWVKLKDPNDEEKGSIYLLTSNATTITAYQTNVMASASEWKELSLTIVVDDPDKKVNVGFANFTDVNLEFYIDDVSVIKVDTSQLFPQTLILNGATATTVPFNGVSEIRLRPTATNQLGGSEGMNNIADSLKWYLENPVEGVEVSQEGILKVYPNAQAGKVTVTAEVFSPLSETPIKASKEIEILPGLYKDEGNLFHNGNFDKNVDGMWKGENLRITSEKAHSNAFSAYLPDGGICGQYVFLQPDKKYLVTAVVNADSISNEFSIITDTAITKTTEKIIKTENNEWHRIFALLDTDKLTENAKVLVSTSSKNNTAYYADSFYIAQMRDEFSECNASVSYFYNGNKSDTLVDGELTVNAVLSNGIGNKSLLIVAALYSETNELEDISYLGNISIDEFQEKPVTLPKKLNVTDSEKQYVKLFVWNSNLNPDEPVNDVVKSDKIVFHVNKNVKDGTVENTFSKISGATSAISNIRKSGKPYPEDGITVILHEGVYQKETMYFLDESWRKRGSTPLTFKAAVGEEVIITGDKNIDGSAFQSASDSEKARLVDAAAREHLVKIDLKAQGVTELGEISLPGSYQLVPYQKIPTMAELVINGKVQNIARYPNSGYMMVDNLIYAGADTKNWTPEQNNNPTEEMLSDGFVFAPSNKRFLNWTNAKEAIMYGYWEYSWADQAIRIASVDTENETITSAAPATYTVKNNGYFYTYNLLEEIDKPGEYYIDRGTGILYLYPPEGVDLKTAEVSITELSSPLVWFRSTHDITFDGVTFANSRGIAIMHEGGTNGVHNIVFKNCTFKNMGGKTNQMHGTVSGLGFDNCKFYDVNGGPSVAGGDYKTLTKGGSYVTNCTFDNFSRITETYNAAIGLSGVGNVASHNTITNGPHYAISLGGNDNIVEYNDISNVLQEGGDMAAIYMGRSWKSRGNVIRYNYIHNIQSNISTNTEFFGSRVGIYGIYLDDLYCDVDIIGNVIADFEGYGVLINGGRDTVVKKNTFVNTYGSLYVTSIGTETGKNMSIHNNDLYTIRTQYDSDLWYRRYPEVYCINDNEPLKPVDNIFTENLLVNSGYQNIDTIAKSVLYNKNNLIYSEDNVENAGFYDYEGKDYSLNDNAEVFQKIQGFYDFSKDITGVR